MSTEALRSGFARGLAEALRFDNPDLTFEVRPLNADDRSLDTGAAEVRRLVPRGDQLQPLASCADVRNAAVAEPSSCHGADRTRNRSRFVNTIWLCCTVLALLLPSPAEAEPEQFPPACTNHPILQTPAGAKARAAKGWNAEALKTSEAAIHRVRLQARCQPRISQEHRVRRQIRRARSDYKEALEAASVENAYGDIDPPGADYLYGLRMCESGGDYSINTGNGFTGAYQFMDTSWASVGGSTSSAYLASPAEQDYRAALLWRTAGPGSWPNCP